MGRESWNTRVGFILAAVGSAVGLGNVWRFPWMTAQNGGSAFLLLYLIVVFAIGIPGLLGELVIGRRANLNPVGAFERLGSRQWRVLGLFSLLTAIVLLSFYSVAGGWVLRYVIDSLTGAYFGTPGEHFGAVSYGLGAVGFHLLFIATTGGIVFLGVVDGIERATKFMVPAIVVLLVGLAAWGLTLEGAGDGIAFYLDFDFEYLQNNFLAVLEAAAGQALFTLSVGAGAMLTYASYIGDDRSLLTDGTSIAVLNTVIGVLAGFVVFPIIFALGLSPGTGGAGVVFVGLAGAFAQIPGGAFVGAAFFAILGLAALSSAISIMEILVAYLVDEYDIGRRPAVAGVTGLFAVTGTACAVDSWLFALVANHLANITLTVGILGFLLFAAWVLGDAAMAEFRKGAGDLADRVAYPWLLTIGIVLPVFLFFTLQSGVFNLLDALDVGLPLRMVGAAVVLTGLSILALRRPTSAL